MWPCRPNKAAKSLQMNPVLFKGSMGSFENPASEDVHVTATHFHAMHINWESYFLLKSLNVIKTFFFHNIRWNVSSTPSITAAHAGTNLPPASTKSRWRPSFSQSPSCSQLLWRPVKSLYIRHLQRGSLCPSYVTREHAEVMDRDRARLPKLSSLLHVSPADERGLLFVYPKWLSSEDNNNLNFTGASWVVWHRQAVTLDDRWGLGRSETKEAFVCRVFLDVRGTVLSHLCGLIIKQKQLLCFSAP